MNNLIVGLRPLVSLALGIAVAGAIMLPGSASAAPVNTATARIAPGLVSFIEPVQHSPGQYRGRRFGNEVARQRFINSRWSRMKVQEDADGFIYLPGIRTDYLGRTTITSAPRTFSQPRRFGERPPGMQRRFGEPPLGGYRRRLGTH